MATTARTKTNPATAPAGLRLAADLVLPAEAVTRTFAVLAVRGAGKTYCAAVLTEELVKARQPVAVVDPVGVWWGLRAGADGTGPGLPVAVLGGERGDVPLSSSMGEAAADLLVEERLPVVLDLSLFRKGEQRRFVADFAERLYHRNRAPLHLVLDEADLWAPQRPAPGQQRLLGAVEDLVRRGRARGLGVTLVSQRPAVLAKDVLSQADTLVALRLVAPQDRTALDAWVRAHGVAEERDALQRSLPSLAVGEAWVWSPGWLGLLRRVRVRRRETFDSSRTPEPQGVPAVPRVLAAVDVARLRERLAAAAPAGTEGAGAAGSGDSRPAPATHHQAPARAVERVEVPVEVRVEVPVLTDAQAAQLTAAVGRLEAVAREMATAAATIRDALARAGRPPTPAQPPTAAAPATERGAPRWARPRVPSRRGADPRLAGGAPARSGAAEGAGAGGALPVPQQRLLDALASFAAVGLAEPARADAAALAGQSPTSSSFAAHIRRLRDAGLVEPLAGGRLGLTAAGHARAAPLPAVAGAAGLREAWLALLPAAQLRLLDALATLERLGVPAVPRGDAAALAGQSPTSSAFEAHAKRLRDRGLVAAAGPGRLALTERGRRVAAPLPEVAGAGDLHRAWEVLLPPAQGRLLRVLLDRHPAAVGREELARAAGQSPTSSSFDGHVRRLRQLGVLEAADGGLRAGPGLFPAGTGGADCAG
jgi:Mn-dependent DtxR family transcriptional regulator